MAHVLKLPHLANGDKVPDMNVVAGGINAIFDAEWNSGFGRFLQLLQQFIHRDDLFHAFLYHFKFVFKSHCLLPLNLVLSLH